MPRSNRVTQDQALWEKPEKHSHNAICGEFMSAISVIKTSLSHTLTQNNHVFYMHWTNTYNSHWRHGRDCVDDGWNQTKSSRLKRDVEI